MTLGTLPSIQTLYVQGGDLLGALDVAVNAAQDEALKALSKCTGCKRCRALFVAWASWTSFMQTSRSLDRRVGHLLDCLIMVLLLSLSFRTNW